MIASQVAISSTRPPSNHSRLYHAPYDRPPNNHPQAPTTILVLAASRMKCPRAQIEWRSRKRPREDAAEVDELLLAAAAAVPGRALALAPEAVVEAGMMEVAGCDKRS